MTLTFSKAVRSQVPLLGGIVGPSGTGKTFSALRIARGIQRVTGGRIKFIDTEHKRALHYADEFDFDHMELTPPFSSLRYLEAIRLAAQTPGPVVVDSLSHEHDGPGGYLEFHEEEVQRLVKNCGFKNDYAASVPAWAKPAEYRRKLIQGIVHLGINAIFCFRAKEKVDMNAKKADGTKTVAKLGWMPIAGEAFVYEMTFKCLLLPGANGVPSWHPEEAGEKLMCKLPGQFRGVFNDDKGNGYQLSEDIGERLALWAAGSAAPAKPRKPLTGEKEILAATTIAELTAAWKKTKWANPAEEQELRAIAAKRKAEIAAAEQPAPPPTTEAEPDSGAGGGGYLFGVDEDQQTVGAAAR